MSLSAKDLKLKRKVRQWLHSNKPKQCPDCLGVPMSSLTVVPKSLRHNGVSL